jgi:hypothetical protein
MELSPSVVGELGSQTFGEDFGLWSKQTIN